MATSYGKILRRTWRGKDFRKLTKEQKLTLVCLWSCPEGAGLNAIFYIEPTMLGVMIGESVDTTTGILSQLEAAGWIQFDFDANVCYLPRQIEDVEELSNNANVAKGMLSKSKELPATPLIETFNEAIAKYLPKPSDTPPPTPPEALPLPLPKGSRTPYPIPEPEPLPEPDTKPAKKRLRAASANADGSHQAFIDYFSSVWSSKTRDGAKYPFQGSKDGQAVRLILKYGGLEMAKRLVDVYLSQALEGGKPYWKQSGYSIAVMYADIAYLVQRLPVHSPVHNGLVEEGDDLYNSRYEDQKSGVVPAKTVLNDLLRDLNIPKVEN